MCQNQCILHSPEWGIHTPEGKLPRLPTGAARLPALSRGKHEWVRGEGVEHLGAMPTLSSPHSRLASPCWGAGGALCLMCFTCLVLAGHCPFLGKWGYTANFKG